MATPSSFARLSDVVGTGPASVAPTMVSACVGRSWMFQLKRNGRRVDNLIGLPTIAGRHRPRAGVGRPGRGLGPEMIAVSATRPKTAYGELARRGHASPAEPERAEDALDSLVFQLKEAERQLAETPPPADPIQAVREQMLNEFIPIFLELAEKYGESKISLEMDAANLLRGGREIEFQFCVGEYRTKLHGTVTTEAIAFHETRYTPHIAGELTSGPMLRLRGLTGEIFRNFLCERLGVLLRTALRDR